MSRRAVTFPSIVALALIALGQAGCPLSDHYYIGTDGSASGGSVANQTDTGTTVNEGGSGASGTTGGGTGGASSGGNGGATDGGATIRCTGSGCWRSMTAPPSSFVGREKAAFTAFNDKLFIFGGLGADGKALNDGAIYDPVSDSWTILNPSPSTPTKRQLSTALWSGSVIYVVGGADERGKALKGTATYDPLTGRWTSLGSLPVERIAPYMANAVNDKYVMTWGGLDAGGLPLSGGEFCNYGGDTWTTITSPAPGFPFPPGPGSTSAPNALSELTWGAGDNGVFLFGGRSAGTVSSALTYQYVPTNNQWSSVLGSGPSARWGAFGVWDEQSFYVWGGRDDINVLNDGSRYALTGDWTLLGTTVAPGARWASHRRAGWSFALGTGDIVVLGGIDGSDTILKDGGRYDESTTEWTPIPAWASGESHEYGVVVVTGGELFVWGGRNGTNVTATGERFLP